MGVGSRLAEARRKRAVPTAGSSTAVPPWGPLSLCPGSERRTARGTDRLFRVRGELLDLLHGGLLQTRNASPNDARKRQTASSFNVVVSAPGAKRRKVRIGPLTQMSNLPAPRSNSELRAPKTAGIRERRDAPAAGPQSTPYARLMMGEKGGSIRGSTSLSSDGSQPESCSGCLDPRDESTRSIASQRLGPRAKRKPVAPAISFIKNNAN